MAHALVGIMIGGTLAAVRKWFAGGIQGCSQVHALR